MKKPVMELYFDDLSGDEFVLSAMDCIEKKEKCVVITPNAEIGLEARRNPALKKAINDAKLVLPDGISVVLASKILGAGIKQKSAGIEFAEGLTKAMAQKGKRLYILGAKPGVAQKACENLAAKYPGLQIAGAHDGYFSAEQEKTVIEEMNETDPDAIFFCLGAPKQELFMDKYKDIIKASVLAGVGGSADIFAGNSKRAPTIFIKLGLEWFYRLLSEPKRIKRMIKLPVYLWDALIWRLGGKKNG